MDSGAELLRDSVTRAFEPENVDVLTPDRKVKRFRSNRSPDKPTDVGAWALGAIRVLQKDVSSLLNVVSDQTKRIAELEKDLRGMREVYATANDMHCFEGFLKLPTIAPCIGDVHKKSALLDDVSSLMDHRCSVLRGEFRDITREMIASAGFGAGAVTELHLKVSNAMVEVEELGKRFAHAERAARDICLQARMTQAGNGEPETCSSASSKGGQAEKKKRDDEGIGLLENSQDAVDGDFLSELERFDSALTKIEDGLEPILHWWRGCERDCNSESIFSLHTLACELDKHMNDCEETLSKLRKKVEFLESERIIMPVWAKGFFEMLEDVKVRLDNLEVSEESSVEG
mmetsp:Transcript_94982/g.164945  ORF Transcript_94982/g.164945 Transcript_94982/m.164945 type:complete len:345 (-) Transcript_94982:77-1111(-)